MSIEVEENNNSNRLIDSCKMANELKHSSKSAQDSTETEKFIHSNEATDKAATKTGATASKERYMSSSDSGEGTAEQLHSDSCSDGHATRNSNRTTSGCLSNEDVRPQIENSPIIESEDLPEAVDEETPGEEDVDEDVAALLRGPAAEAERPPSLASENDNRSRTLSWVRSCNDDVVPFSSHLDVQAYYRVTKGDKPVDAVLKKMRSTDRYKRRANYDPDKPAIGSLNDAEYKFYLDKVCVKKLIGSLGENSEMIRAMNEVDFYISKDQSGEAVEEIVTVRGEWSNVVRTVLDIRDMMYSVGKEICIDHINTAVRPQEFILQHYYNNFVHIRLNVAEPVIVNGAVGISVLMHNIEDPRYVELQRMGEELNIVYNQLPGWDKIVSEPPELVPLPVNDFSVVIAPDGNGSFYRSLVEKSDLKSGEVSVWFLDYGGRATLPVTSLFKLHRYFTQLPYMSLNGYLAGCQLKDETRSDEFGRFLWDFVSRYCPLKATAVNMDNMGNYYILLHGYGGECINHILIDQGYVESVPYQILQPLEEINTNTPMIYYNKKTKMREKFYLPQYQPVDANQPYNQNYSADRAEYVPPREPNYYRKNYRPNHRNQSRKSWNYHNGRNRYRGQGQYESNRPGRSESRAQEAQAPAKMNGSVEQDRLASQEPSRVASGNESAAVQEAPAPVTKSEDIPKAVPPSEDPLKCASAPETSERDLSNPALREKPSSNSNPVTSRKTVAAVVADTLCSAAAQNANNFCSDRSSSMKNSDPKRIPKSACNGISVRTVPNSSMSDRRSAQVTSSSVKAESRTSSSPVQGAGVDPDSWILVDKQKKRKSRRNKKM